MVDKVKPLKIENTSTGGDENDYLPTEVDPAEDYIATKGIAFENTDTELIWKDGDDIKFSDTALSGTTTLSNLFRGRGTLNPQNTISVAKNGNNTTGTGSHHNPYLTISYAISTITDSGEDNRYLISVGPGVFSEPLINVPAYVCVMGSTIQNTIINPDSDDHHLFVLNEGCEISFLTLRDVGTGYAAVTSIDAGDFTQTHKVSIYDCDIGILITSSSEVSIHYAEYVDFNGTYTHAIKCTSLNGYLSKVNAENVYTYPDECLGAQFYGTGDTTEIDLLAGSILGEGADTAVKVQDSVILSIDAISIMGSGIGIHIPTTGSGPTVKCSGVTLLNETKDIWIESTTTTGFFRGSLTRSKYFNSSSNSIQFSYQDPANGDFNITRILATRGFATDLTTITTASQTTAMVSTDAHTYILIGSTAGQILTLPDATTLRVGHQFWILNESSVDVTINKYGGTLDEVLVPASNTRKALRDNSTAAGVWTKSLGASFLTGKLRDPRFFAMNGTVSNGDWIAISNLLSNYKYVFTEDVRLIGIEWANGNGNLRDFDLVFYKNGTSAGNIIRTYQVRNSTYDYGYDSGWTETFTTGDYMRVQYVDQGDNVSDFGGRFNFEVL